MGVLGRRQKSRVWDERKGIELFFYSESRGGSIKGGGGGGMDNWVFFDNIGLSGRLQIMIHQTWDMMPVLNLPPFMRLELGRFQFLQANARYHTITMVQI